MSKLPKLSNRSNSIKRKVPNTPIGKNIKSGKKQKADPIMIQYMKYYNEAIEKYGSQFAVLVQVG